MILVDATTAPPQPWRNGGGVTRELLRLPAQGDDWALRISVADIAADGPFSPFPGVERWFAVAQGAGVRLELGGRALDLRAGDAPLRFDGAEAPGCRLLDGATRDLNVMTRRDRARARLVAARWSDDAEAGAEADTGFGFFALRPLVLHGLADAPMAMPALSLAWHDTPARGPRRVRVEPADATDLAAPPGWWIHLLPPTR